MLDKILDSVTEFKDKIGKSDLEKKLVSCTSNKNWMIANKELYDIAERTFSISDCDKIFKHIYEKMNSPPKQWRKIYKALYLAEFLLRNGDPRCISEIRNLSLKIRMLEGFNYSEGGSEKGTGVRDKAKSIGELLNNQDLLMEEREKSRQVRMKIGGSSITGGDRYGGFSSSDYKGSYGGSGSGYNSSSYGNYDNPYPGSYAFGGQPSYSTYHKPNIYADKKVAEYKAAPEEKRKRKKHRHDDDDDDFDEAEDYKRKKEKKFGKERKHRQSEDEQKHKPKSRKPISGPKQKKEDPKEQQIKMTAAIGELMKFDEEETTPDLLFDNPQKSSTSHNEADDFGDFFSGNTGASSHPTISNPPPNQPPIDLFQFVQPSNVPPKPQTDLFNQPANTGFQAPMGGNQSTAFQGFNNQAPTTFSNPWETKPTPAPQQIWEMGAQKPQPKKEEEFEFDDFQQAEPTQPPKSTEAEKKTTTWTGVEDLFDLSNLSKNYEQKKTPEKPLTQESILYSKQDELDRIWNQNQPSAQFSVTSSAKTNFVPMNQMKPQNPQPMNMNYNQRPNNPMNQPMNPSMNMNMGMNMGMNMNMRGGMQPNYRPNPQNPGMGYGSYNYPY